MLVERMGSWYGLQFEDVWSGVGEPWRGSCVGNRRLRSAATVGGRAQTLQEDCVPKVHVSHHHCTMLYRRISATPPT